MPELDLSDRPRPIMDAFRTVGSAVALLGSIVTALVGWGVLTVAQGDALAGLIGAIPGITALVTALLAAFGVVRASEGAVTPVSDPMDHLGRSLVAE